MIILVNVEVKLMVTSNNIIEVSVSMANLINGDIDEL